MSFTYLHSDSGKRARASLPAVNERGRNVEDTEAIDRVERTKKAVQVHEGNEALAAVWARRDGDLAENRLLLDARKPARWRH